jgi:hypothetical protein
MVDLGSGLKEKDRKRTGKGKDKERKRTGK